MFLIIGPVETAFYKNSWQNVSASGSSSRYYREVTDPKFYPELQVKERRCKKEEIRKAYIEYLKMIYKYNLSDAS